jgi:hypothetical protein
MFDAAPVPRFTAGSDLKGDGMFGSDILDIAVGMILVYLMLSLILTAVQETIEAWVKSRASNLERAITELLQGDKTLVTDFYDHPLIYALHSGTRDGGADKRQRPSYIPRSTFAAVLIDLMQKEPKLVNADLKRAYDGLDKLAGGNVTKLRRELEGWYDGAMDRASGWYKRSTHSRLFWLGLAVALLLNVNSVMLAQHLATDPQSRELANQLAASVATSPPGEDQQKLNAYTDQLEQIGLPIGWDTPAVKRIASSFPTRLEAPGPFYYFNWLGALIALLLGYAITGLAVTLGAPFWFDLLNKFMVIRSTVKPTEKSPDEASEDSGGNKAPSSTKS